MRPEFIVIHHSLTKDGATVSWSAIRRYHTETLGWRDIGYHWGIELVGEHYEILLGRWWDEAGAHAKEAAMNGRSLGICLVGNFDVEDPPAGQIDVALKLVRRLRVIWDIPRDHVLGHREVGLMAGFDWTKGQYKTCPGRRFDMDQFRDALTL